jgi:iron(III) transport system substrate-binding protein
MDTPRSTATTAESIQRNHGLVINGEQIATPELWTRAQAEGHITLYSGYTQDSERRCWISSTPIPV